MSFPYISSGFGFFLVSSVPASRELGVVGLLCLQPSLPILDESYGAVLTALDDDFELAVRREVGDGDIDTAVVDTLIPPAQSSTSFLGAFLGDLGSVLDDLFPIFRQHGCDQVVGRLSAADA